MITTKTSEQYLAAIPEAVRPRLIRAIRELLMAGRDTHKVAEALKPQASFGKYEGCYEAALRSIAYKVCQDLNKETREQNRQIAQVASASIREFVSSFSK